MMKFVVTIKEIVSEDFLIEANNSDEAINIAREKYKNSEYVLEPGSVLSVKLKCSNKTENEATEWIEL